MNGLLGIMLISIGVLFDLLGCIGLARLPDVYNRLQAATKCVTLGTCFILFGVLSFGGISAMGIKALVCIAFILITSPTGAHALAKGAHAAGVKLWGESVCDEYEKDK